MESIDTSTLIHQEKLTEDLTTLKKRTYQMFLGQVEDELGLAGPTSKVQDEVVKAKFENKHAQYYKDIGKVPGIVVEENKRRKIVKELGGEIRGEKPSSATLVEEEKKQQPESNEGMIMVSQTTAELTKQTAEREKTQALSMIPDKYRIKEAQEVKSTSTALSLVNALANNQNSIAIRSRKIVQPQWHAPWKLKTVISGH